jgi:superfamily II DNA or RNA helicase
MLGLRPYQIDAKRAVLAKLAEADSTLVEMATGLGKTILFSHIAHEWPGRVLILAHRDELIRQAADKIQTITGRGVGVEMGRARAGDDLFDTKVILASVQTLARLERRDRYPPDYFSLIVVDEGHHATASTYRQVLDHFRSAKRLFVTATPKRADQVALGTVCETVAFQYGIEAAIDDGWLVPVRQTVVKVEGLDFSKARSVAGDFNQADLEAILTAEKPLHAMCVPALEQIGNRQALWFCVSVDHAKAIAAVLGRYATGGVQFLSGETPVDVRRHAVDAYKAARIQHLVNCALFLEGLDAPATSVIVMGRPTKSLGLYMQVLGRGTRPLPGVVDAVDTAAGRRELIALSPKPNMLVIDFAGNAGRHKIVQAADVLGGKQEAPVREYAKKTMEAEGHSVDVEESLARAAAELALEAEENERRNWITGKATYLAYDVDPFTRQYSGRTNGNGVAPPKRTEPCSNKQAGLICHLSRQVGGKWTFAKAKQLSRRQVTGVIKGLLALGAKK